MPLLAARPSSPDAQGAVFFLAVAQAAVAASLGTLLLTGEQQGGLGASTPEEFPQLLRSNGGGGDSSSSSLGGDGATHVRYATCSLSPGDPQLCTLTESAVAVSLLLTALVAALQRAKPRAPLILGAAQAVLAWLGLLWCLGTLLVAAERSKAANAAGMPGAGSRSMLCQLAAVQCLLFGASWSVILRDLCSGDAWAGGAAGGGASWWACSSGGGKGGGGVAAGAKPGGAKPHLLLPLRVGGRLLAGGHLLRHSSPRSRLFCILEESASDLETGLSDDLDAAACSAATSRCTSPLSPPRLSYAGGDTAAASTATAAAASCATISQRSPREAGPGPATGAAQAAAAMAAPLAAAGAGGGGAAAVAAAAAGGAVASEAALPGLGAVSQASDDSDDSQADLELLLLHEHSE